MESMENGSSLLPFRGEVTFGALGDVTLLGVSVFWGGEIVEEVGVVLGVCISLWPLIGVTIGRSMVVGSRLVPMNISPVLW